MKYLFLRSRDLLHTNSGLQVERCDVPVHRIIYVQQGQGTYYLDDHILSVNDGDVFIAAPGYRQIDFPGKQTVQLKIINFMAPAHWMTKPYERFQSHGRHRQLLLALIDDLIYGQVRRRDNTLQLAVDLFIEQGELTIVNNRKIYEIAEQIRSQPELKYNITELARRCNCSVSHFRALFSKEIHQSPKSFIKKCKMDLALVLLRDEHLQVKKVATTVGFNDIHAFSKQFKQYFGKSPLAIIQRKRK